MRFLLILPFVSGCALMQKNPEAISHAAQTASEIASAGAALAGPTPFGLALGAGALVLGLVVKAYKRKPPPEKKSKR